MRGGVEDWIVARIFRLDRESRKSLSLISFGYLYSRFPEVPHSKSERVGKESVLVLSHPWFWAVSNSALQLRPMLGGELRGPVTEMPRDCPTKFSIRHQGAKEASLFLLSLTQKAHPIPSDNPLYDKIRQKEPPS